MSEKNEQDDLARSLQGDGEAYARVVSRYQGQVARRMRSFAREPAVVEELVQEVFVNAYYGLAGYRGEGPFAAWLARIATRVGYRYWQKRSQGREVSREENWWGELAEQKIEQLDPATAGRIVHHLLARLPPRDRLVLMLVYVEGHSIAEAAELAGWSKTMTKVQAFRARRKLRAVLAEMGIDSAETAYELLGDISSERGT